MTAYIKIFWEGKPCELSTRKIGTYQRTSQPPGVCDPPRATSAITKGVHDLRIRSWPKKPSSAEPQPTTNTTVVNGVAFHFTPFEPAGIDPSSIADFSGLVGVADVQGTGTATSPDQRPRRSSSIPTCTS